MQTEHNLTEQEVKASTELKLAIIADCNYVNKMFIEISEMGKDHDFMALIYHNKAVVNASLDANEETLLLVNKLEKASLPTFKLISNKIKEHLGKDDKFVVVIDANSAALYSSKNGEAFSIEKAIEAHLINHESKNTSLFERLINDALRDFGVDSLFGKYIRAKLEQVIDDSGCDCGKCITKTDATIKQPITDHKFGEFFPN